MLTGKGLIGLAWVASPNEVGGVCTRYQYHLGGSILPSGLYSLNSLTVTQMIGEERMSDGLSSMETTAIKTISLISDFIICRTTSTFVEKK